MNLANNKIENSFQGNLKGISYDGNIIIVSIKDTIFYRNLRLGTQIKLPLEKTDKYTPITFDRFYPSNYGSWFCYNTTKWQLPEYKALDPEIIVLYNINNGKNIKIADGIISGNEWFSEDNLHFAAIISKMGYPISQFLLFKLDSDGIYKKDTVIDGVYDFCASASKDEIYLSFRDGSIKIMNLSTKVFRDIFFGAINQPISIQTDSSDNIKVYAKPGKFFTWNLKKGFIQDYRSLYDPFLYSKIILNKERTYGIAADTSFLNLYLIDLSARSPVTKKILTYYEKLKLNSWKNEILFFPDNENFLLTSYCNLKMFSLDGLEQRSVIPFYPNVIERIDFSKDGQLIALSNCLSKYDSLKNTEGLYFDYGIFSVLNAKNLDTICKMKIDGTIFSMTFSPDDKELWFTTYQSASIKTYSISNRSFGDDFSISQYSESFFSKKEWEFMSHPMNFVKSQLLGEVFIQTKSKLYWVDPDTRQVNKVITLKDPDVYPLLSNNKKWLFYVSKGGSIEIWDIENDKLLCSLYSIDSSDYVVKTPNGLFDASPGAMKKMSYVAGMETIDLDQLKARYYQPGLLQILLGYKGEKLRDVQGLNEIELYPSTKLQIINNKLNITLENRGGGIGEVSLFIENAEKISDLRPPSFNPDTASSTITYDLAELAGYFDYDTTNVISVITKNKEGYLRSRPDTVHFWPEGKGRQGEKVKGGSGNPRLFAVVAGIADYEGSKIDLRFAGKDAGEFAHALDLGAENLFGVENVDIHLLTTDSTGSDFQPTKANIIAAFDSISNGMNGAGPKDYLVVYLAGHGINYGGPDGDFYYLTREAFDTDPAIFTDPALRESITISASELTDMINNIPARKKVLILDVCAAGRAAEQITTGLREVPGNVTRVLDNMQDRTGIYILAGCEADAVSYETTVYGQGLLTYSLLSAMKGNALKMDSGDEYVDVNTLLQYARDQVPVLSANALQRQTPFIKVPDNDMGYYIGRMTDETKKMIRLSQPKPVFTASRFFMEKMPYDKLGLEDIADKALINITLAGKNAELVYSDAKNLPDSYSLSGSYTINGDQVTVSLLVLYNQEPITPPLSLTGNVGNLDKLSRDIIFRAYREIKQKPM